MKSIQSKSQLKEEEVVLLGLLSKEMFQIPYTPGKDVPWEAVVKESIHQSTLLTAFSHSERLDIASGLRREIKRQSEEYMKANLLNVQWHGQVHLLMEELGIPYCILKGVASAAYYPEPLLRQMGDVDFLVRKEDLDLVGKRLESMGFTCMKEKEYHHHVDYEKDNVLLEVHFDSPGIPKGETESIVRKYLDDLLEKSQMIENALFPVRVPSAFHHGLVMLLHLQEHLMTAGIGIRHLCDWAVFIHGISNEEFKRQFQSPLQEMGLWKLAQTFSLASVNAFGIDRKEWMGEDDELAQSLLVDVLSGGTAGSKDSQRLYEGMFISDSRKLSLHKGRGRQLFDTLNQMAYRHWPYMRRCKLMLPVGWFMLYMMQWHRVITGEREKMNYLEAYKKSSGRKELYQKLKVFEREI